MIAECPIMKREVLGSQLTDYLPHHHHTTFITQAWPIFFINFYCSKFCILKFEKYM